MTSTPMLRRPSVARRTAEPGSGPPPARRRRPRLLRRQLLLPIFTLTVFPAVWETVSHLGLGGFVQYISSPSGCASAFWTMIENGELWPSVRVSVIAFAIGFAISLAIGIPLGLAMGWNRTLRELLEPPLMAAYVMPRLALLPVVVVWLGIGIRSTVVIVVVDAVFPVIINTMAGVRNTDTKLVQVARSFGARRGDLFRKVLLPASIPAILTGVRLAVARGILGVIVAQLYVSTVGLGHLISVYGQQYQTDYIVVLVLLVGIFGYAVNIALQRVERRFETWRGGA
jgi:ABC-type nitrate/sulfonate/bicarbonate transport system permease component